MKANRSITSYLPLVMPALIAGAATVVLNVGCGNGGSAAPAGSSSAAPPGLEAASDAGTPTLKPTSLVRKTTPQDKRIADEKACEGGDVAACRRMADRHRGYGHIAGCGLERPGPKPRRLVTAVDYADDDKGFDKWIRKVCDSGNEEACLQGQNNLRTARVTPRSSHACTRSSVSDCPMYQWAVGMHPEKTKLIDDARRLFIETGSHGKLFAELFRKEKTRGGDAVPKDVADLAERTCKTTHECDEVMMMLDENGYSTQAVAPIKKLAGEALATACLEGDCVCGEAAHYLDPADARIADLARIGCDDGEPEACFILGDLYDRGAGVEKDATKAFTLYKLACPTIVADDGRADIVSKAACDRLSAKYEEGTDVPHDRMRAFFYVNLACPAEGIELNHSFCVHRAVYHSKYDFRSRRDYLISNPEAARLILYGADNDPVNAKECERPSVAELCQKTVADIPMLKKR